MQEPNSAIGLFIAWLPLILMMATGWYVAHQIRRGLFTKDGRSLADVTAELVVELKKLTGRVD